MYEPQQNTSQQLWASSCYFHRYARFLQVSIRLEFFERKKLYIFQPVSPLLPFYLWYEQNKNENWMEGIFILYQPEAAADSCEAAEGSYEAREL
jgi:hypothetical protein